ncbi:MAG TPA: DUF3820 family protein [Chthoniobacteraceae bacterium]|nr:DUF3820 family protein [Chthoniobacteraceae bacterium]
MERFLANHMAADLADIGKMRMPFGKYGPEHFPPRGIPIYDLPAEYLHWFTQHGWPSGELGRLLRIVYQMKVDGSDAAFDIFRKAAGGRAPLRPPRRRDFKL